MCRKFTLHHNNMGIYTKISMKITDFAVKGKGYTVLEN